MLPINQEGQICPKEGCLLAKLVARQDEILERPLLGQRRDPSKLKKGT